MIFKKIWEKLSWSKQKETIGMILCCMGLVITISVALFGERLVIKISVCVLITVLIFVEAGLFFFKWNNSGIA